MNMSIRVGTKVKVIKIIETTDEFILRKKSAYLGVEGIVYGTPIIFYGAKNNGYAEEYDGKHIYSINSNGKNIPYGWFAEELEIIEE